MHRSNPQRTAPDTSLVDSLMRPAAFKHPVGLVEFIETHISWLILTDKYVYKLKKPIVLDFLDFGDIERRKFYCEEEIRLNQPWAPDIYLDVVPVTLENGQAVFAGSGIPVDYAVRMRRFDQEMRLDAQLEHGKLLASDMKELARNIAERHAGAKVAAQVHRDRFISLTIEFIWDNFAALEGFIDAAQLDSLRQWTAAELEKTGSELRRRFAEGFVRDCHGDLHLANLVRLPDGITTFDCIEFNEDLRRIDVVCDVAFLIMDLVSRERHDLAAQFLNRYLECTGDYAGVTLLNLYFVYRCLVRAKVAVILSQQHETDDGRAADLEEAHRYCDMAQRQIARRYPLLVVMSGFSGSGKTWVSEQLMAAMPAVRVRSDTERKRLSGLDETQDSASAVGKGLYTEQKSRDVYARLCKHAATILESGHNVILDAAFLSAADRAKALQIAKNCGCKAAILAVRAPHDVLRKRIQSRSSRGEDASEAGLDVLEYQIKTAEPLTDRESERSVICDNDGELDIAAIAKRLKALAVS
jgi:aminoglycoside phosphotransferase family enzyme/predicted kinase